MLQFVNVTTSDASTTFTAEEDGYYLLVGVAAGTSETANKYVTDTTTGKEVFKWNKWFDSDNTNVYDEQSNAKACYNITMYYLQTGETITTTQRSYSNATGYIIFYKVILPSNILPPQEQETLFAGGTSFNDKVSLVDYTVWGKSTGTKSYTVEEDNMILMVFCEYHASINSGSLGDWSITGNTGEFFIINNNELVSNTANNFDNKLYTAILYPNKGDVITCSYTSPSGNTGENMMYLSIQIDKLISNSLKLLETTVMESTYNTVTTITNADKWTIPYESIDVTSGLDSVIEVSNGIFTTKVDLAEISLIRTGCTSLNETGTSTSAGHNTEDFICIDGVYTSMGELTGSTHNYSKTYKIKNIPAGTTISFAISCTYAGATPYFVNETVTFSAIVASQELPELASGNLELIDSSGTLQESVTWSTTIPMGFILAEFCCSDGSTGITSITLGNNTEYNSVKIDNSGGYHRIFYFYNPSETTLSITTNSRNYDQSMSVYIINT